MSPTAEINIVTYRMFFSLFRRDVDNFAIKSVKLFSDLTDSYRVLRRNDVRLGSGVSPFDLDRQVDRHSHHPSP